MTLNLVTGQTIGNELAFAQAVVHGNVKKTRYGMSDFNYIPESDGDYMPDGSDDQPWDEEINQYVTQK